MWFKWSTFNRNIVTCPSCHISCQIFDGICGQGRTPPDLGAQAMSTCHDFKVTCFEGEVHNQQFMVWIVKFVKRAQKSDADVEPKGIDYNQDELITGSWRHGQTPQISRCGNSLFSQLTPSFTLWWNFRRSAVAEKVIIRSLGELPWSNFVRLDY